MSIDIVMLMEHKNCETKEWNMVKNPNWENNMIPVNRNNALFYILCGYDKDEFFEFDNIRECKGVPTDADLETLFWLVDLPYTSYLSLDEILDFDWDKKVYYCEENYKYSEIAREFYTEIIPYMLSIDTNHKNVRIVFGLSCEVQDIGKLSKAFIKQGIEQEKVSIAKIMIMEKESIEKIQKYTGLSIKKLNRIKKESN